MGANAVNQKRFDHSTIRPVKRNHLKLFRIFCWLFYTISFTQLLNRDRRVFSEKIGGKFHSLLENSFAAVFIFEVVIGNPAHTSIIITQTTTDDDHKKKKKKKLFVIIQENNFGFRLSLVVGCWSLKSCVE